MDLDCMDLWVVWAVVEVVGQHIWRMDLQSCLEDNYRWGYVL